MPKCQVPVECDWGASLFWREAFEKAEHWPIGSLSAKSLVKLVGCALTLLIFVQVLSAAESSPLRSQWGESSDGVKCACLMFPHFFLVSHGTAVFGFGVLTAWCAKGVFEKHLQLPVSTLNDLPCPAMPQTECHSQTLHYQQLNAKGIPCQRTLWHLIVYESMRNAWHDTTSCNRSNPERQTARVIDLWYADAHSTFPLLRIEATSSWLLSSTKQGHTTFESLSVQTQLVTVW